MSRKELAGSLGHIAHDVAFGEHVRARVEGFHGIVFAKQRERLPEQIGPPFECGEPAVGGREAGPRDLVAEVERFHNGTVAEAAPEGEGRLQVGGESGRVARGLLLEAVGQQDRSHALAVRLGLQRTRGSRAERMFEEAHPLFLPRLPSLFEPGFILRASGSVQFVDLLHPVLSLEIVLAPTLVRDVGDALLERAARRRRADPIRLFRERRNGLRDSGKSLGGRPKLATGIVRLQRRERGDVREVVFTRGVVRHFEHPVAETARQNQQHRGDPATQGDQRSAGR